MENLKVIATDISNLTDARYFAAWGVDMLCYTVNDTTEGLTIQQIKEISDWVEGPLTGIKMDGLSVPDALAESDIAVDAYIISPFIERTLLPTSTKVVYRICTMEDDWQQEDRMILLLSKTPSAMSSVDKGRIQSAAKSKTIFIDGNFTAQDLSIITDMGVAGIILKGGEEEKVGFKSYEELDELLEAIYD